MLGGAHGHKWQRPALGTCEAAAHGSAWMARRAGCAACRGGARGQCSLAKSGSPLDPRDEKVPEATGGLLEVSQPVDWQASHWQRRGSG